MVRRVDAYDVSVWVTEEGFVFDDAECTKTHRCFEHDGEWHVALGDCIPISVANMVYFAFTGVSCPRGCIGYLDGNHTNNHIKNLICRCAY